MRRRAILLVLLISCYTFCLGQSGEIKSFKAFHLILSNIPVARLSVKNIKQTYHRANPLLVIQWPNFCDALQMTTDTIDLDYPENAFKVKLFKSAEPSLVYKFKSLLSKLNKWGLFIAVMGIGWLYWRKNKNNTRNLRLQFEQAEANANALGAANRGYIQLMKMVAHDLRSPIGAVSAIASIMIEKEQPEELYELVVLIETAAKSSLELINELLKTDFGQHDLLKEEIFLEEILQPCVELLRFNAKDKGQRLIYNNELQLKVDVDKEKMWRVINNLIGNAIKFSPERSDIIVDAFRTEKGVVVKVKDNGIGIPLTLQDKIFDAFSLDKRNGTKGERSFGLGLYISKQVIEAHQGEIWFKSEPEKGTEFFIEIPFSSIAT